MATVWTATHIIVGMTKDGHKIVSTNLVPDTGTGGGNATISPLRKVLSWVFGVKHPGTTPRTFIATMSGNVATVTPSANATGATVCITSIGD